MAATTYIPQDARLTDETERTLVREFALQQERIDAINEAYQGLCKAAAGLYRLFVEVRAQIVAARANPVYIGR